MKGKPLTKFTPAPYIGEICRYLLDQGKLPDRTIFEIYNSFVDNLEEIKSGQTLIVLIDTDTGIPVLSDPIMPIMLDHDIQIPDQIVMNSPEVDTYILSAILWESFSGDIKVSMEEAVGELIKFENANLEDEQCFVIVSSRTRKTPSVESPTQGTALFNTCISFASRAGILKIGNTEESDNTWST